MHVYAKDKPGLWLSRGATPTLMGFGPDEDDLVVLSDAGDPVKIVAFSRDTIPADARTMEGAPPRRTASTIELGFPGRHHHRMVGRSLRRRVLMLASDFPDPAILPDARAHALQTTLLSMGYTRQGPIGAQRFTWNSDTKSLESAWTYAERSMAWTLAPISQSESTIYLTTLHDGDMILVGLDWATGEQTTTIRLPHTYKVNTFGQFIYPLPDRSLLISGAFGPIRIHPLQPKLITVEPCGPAALTRVTVLAHGSVQPVAVLCGSDDQWVGPDKPPYDTSFMGECETGGPLGLGRWLSLGSGLRHLVQAN